MTEAEPKKSLGQHWLRDRATITSIVAFSGVNEGDNVLEIGAGPGDLTRQLLKVGAVVQAVEIDEEWAGRLPEHQNLIVRREDIRKFDLSSLNTPYHVVANLPYYLTSYVLRLLTTSLSPPASITVLVQKEVAERIAAGPGKLSLLALSMQLYGTVELGPIVPANLFDPPPKVDSQLVRAVRHSAAPTHNPADNILRLARVGFASKRKTLINNLASLGQHEKAELAELLKDMGLSPAVRAQELKLSDWDSLVSRLDM